MTVLDCSWTFKFPGDEGRTDISCAWDGQLSVGEEEGGTDLEMESGDG